MRWPRPVIDSGAVFDASMVYRYLLWRQWKHNPSVCLFIMLNPSKAGERLDDPSIRRCADYAKRWGHGALWVANMFAFRATNPLRLVGHPDPIGPQNDYTIREAAMQADLVVCAWGTKVPREHSDRPGNVRGSIQSTGKTPMCLTQCIGGEPGHPLYLRKDLWPVPW